MKPPLIVLTGPTAVGKTALSIELARALNGEIISADSMQVYRCMDIGSATVTPEEMQGIRHYLIDELDPSAEFNVVRFKQMAKKALEEIYSRGKLPIVAGGTGEKSMLLPCWASGKMVSQEIRLPASWGEGVR